jgi:hypothetical protein
MDILFLCQNTTEANAWYRTSGIAKNLIKQTGYNIKVVNWQEIVIDWSIIIQYDVVLMQRPFSKEALSLGQYIKACGVKLWLDYDDNILEMNPENKNYTFYNKPDTKQNIISILSIADAVSVSTGLLKSALNDYNHNIQVIPNAFNEIIKRPKPREREKIVFWRGSDGHIYNLWANGSVINKLINDHEDWNFDFMGYFPWFLDKRIRYIEPADIIVYFNTISKIAPSVFHAPLISDNFNACRSNISFIEGAFAGAVCIVPEFWLSDNKELPGALIYRNQQEYQDAIEACIKGDVDIKKNNEKSWKYVKEHLSLEKINKKRIFLLNNL